MDLNIHDVEAATDTFRELTERSDDLNLSEALAYLEALKHATQALREAVAMVETQLRQRLDSPTEANGILYYLKKDGKWRPDNLRIRKKVIDACAVDANGELRDTRGALNMMWGLMEDMYISPSGMPKKAGLDRLGLKSQDISEWESTGTKVVAQPVEGPE